MAKFFFVRPVTCQVVIGNRGAVLSVILLISLLTCHVSLYFPVPGLVSRAMSVGHGS